jgi:hypothetical protein
MFNMQRACFWLLAGVIAVMLIMELIAALGCVLGVLMSLAEPGICVRSGIVQIVRETWSETLTAVLALLVAGHYTPPPPPPPNNKPPEE